VHPHLPPGEFSLRFIFTINTKLRLSEQRSMKNFYPASLVVCRFSITVLTRTSLVAPQVWLESLHKALSDSFSSNRSAPNSPALFSPSLRPPQARHAMSMPRLGAPSSGSQAAASPLEAAAAAAAKETGSGGSSARKQRILIADDDKGQVSVRGGLFAASNSSWFVL
jgi:hypothetical protein